MREKHLFAKRVMMRGDNDACRDARQVSVESLLFFWQHERDERGARFYNLQAELTREIVALRGRADFGNGETARSDHQDWGAKLGGVGSCDELRRMLNFLYFGIQNNLDIGIAAFGFQHIRDVLRGAVAEELAELLFVVANAVLFDERDEIGGGTAGEGGFREVFVGADEIFGLGVPIREIAATAAGDKDFLAAALGSLEDGDATPAFTGFDSAHQAGGATADHDGVEGICGDRFGHFCGVPHQG
jgi:hypothetical protein